MRSLQELDLLVMTLQSLEAEVKTLRKQATEIDEKADTLRAEIMRELEEQGVDSFKGNTGTVSIATKFCVRMPSDMTVKAELADYMREKGIFDAMWTVNYNSLNSWYNDEVQAAKDAGVYPDIPGLEPKSEKNLQLRKAK